jgi:hypothetical protein
MRRNAVAMAVVTCLAVLSYVAAREFLCLERPCSCVGEGVCVCVCVCVGVDKAPNECFAPECWLNGECEWWVHTDAPWQRQAPLLRAEF